MNIKLKRFLKISLITLSLILLIAISVGYWVLKSINLNDGPFTGVARNHCDLKNPRSTLMISPNKYLESFDPIEDEGAPTVRLMNQGKIKWCIYAYGLDKTNVYSIEFSSIKKEEYDKKIIAGSVHWTFGHESAEWYLDNSGNLIEYWYS